MIKIGKITFRKGIYETKIIEGKEYAILSSVIDPSKPSINKFISTVFVDDGFETDIFEENSRIYALIRQLDADGDECCSDCNSCNIKDGCCCDDEETNQDIADSIDEIIDLFLSKVLKASEDDNEKQKEQNRRFIAMTNG
ncbi:MAG: hypothetical protein N2749_01035 [Clostridia bacterium]|nr:hypothetical protein [Clostridia bacterium]